MEFVPLVKMMERARVDRQDSDTTYFWCLMYQGEFLVKLIVSALVSAVSEERDSHKYRICSRLARAAGIGEWSQALDDLLTGPASQFLDQLARDEKRELTQRVDATRWQHKAVASLHRCLEELDIDTDRLPTKCSLQRWFSDFVLLRNKTRGHGAPKGSKCARLCEHLALSINVVTENLGLFGRPWAYLHRNLSGKYRVTHLAGDNSPFAHLKRTTDMSIPDGVYIFLSELCHVALVSSDPESTDFFVPNGGFNGNRYELLSYISGDTQHVDAAPYLTPTEELPPSESEGIGQLDVYGNCFSNLPALPRGYIARPVLESELLEQLNLERHPIVTLTGPGGIGKTWLALKVLYNVVQNDAKRFNVVVWFSARDIDLLPDGPKVVQPHVLSVGEFAKEYVELIEPAERIESGFKPADFLSAELTKSKLGPILFVFDNFETVKNPAEIFAWIDTFVRPPNKVLITTRKREFAGDYPVTMTGMTQDECDELIDAVASTLGITSYISESYREELYRESDGHPYVIKILLGEVAKERRPRKVERIIAEQGAVLTALFERTYSSLSPAGQRVFLSLCNWRSTVPAVALEAVLLRPENERFNFREALQELVQSSLVEEIIATTGDVFLYVPLAASLFGKRKLEASPWKSSVVADSEFLRLLGPGTKTYSVPSAHLRLDRLFKDAAVQISEGKFEVTDLKPILEFVSQKYPKGWLLLAELHEEDGPTRDLIAAREYVRRYLEHPEDTAELSRVWMRLADLCAETDDWLGEIHALSALTKSGNVPINVVSNVANRINGTLRRTDTNLSVDELRLLLTDIIEQLEIRRDELGANDCSRLAWLYIKLHDKEKAHEIAEFGLTVDQENPHCQRLVEKFSI